MRDKLRTAEAAGLTRAIPTAPVMTPEQLAFWLRGLAEGNVLGLPYPTDLLVMILDAAKRCRVPAPPAEARPCGCGGQR